MEDREKAKIGVELARRVINLSHQCDRSKLDQIELDRLNEVVELSRAMFCDSGEYLKEDDQGLTN